MKHHGYCTTIESSIWWSFHVTSIKICKLLHQTNNFSFRQMEWYSFSRFIVVRDILAKQTPLDCVKSQRIQVLLRCWKYPLLHVRTYIGNINISRMEWNVFKWKLRNWSNKRLAKMKSLVFIWALGTSAYSMDGLGSQPEHCCCTQLLENVWRNIYWWVFPFQLETKDLSWGKRLSGIEEIGIKKNHQVDFLH